MKQQLKSVKFDSYIYTADDIDNISSDIVTKNESTIGNSLSEYAKTKDVKICVDTALGDCATTGYIDKTVKSAITIDGVTDGELSDHSLSLLHISEDDYMTRLETGGLNNNTVYFLSSTYLNAYDMNIKYVGDPEDDQDAATKNYVDTKINSKVSNCLSSISVDITNDDSLKNAVSSIVQLLGGTIL